MSKCIGVKIWFNVVFLISQSKNGPTVINLLFKVIKVKKYFILLLLSHVCALDDIIFSRLSWWFLVCYCFCCSGFDMLLILLWWNHLMYRELSKLKHTAVVLIFFFHLDLCVDPRTANHFCPSLLYVHPSLLHCAASCYLPKSFLLFWDLTGTASPAVCLCNDEKKFLPHFYRLSKPAGRPEGRRF